MKKYFYIRKQSQRLSFYSQDKSVINKEIFKEIQMDITPTQLEQIQSAKVTYIKANKFVIIPYSETDIKPIKIKAQKIKELKTRVQKGNLTLKETQQIVKDLLLNLT